MRLSFSLGRHARPDRDDASGVTACGAMRLFANYFPVVSRVLADLTPTKLTLTRLSSPYDQHTAD